MSSSKNYALALAFFAFLGILVSLYLTYLHYAPLFNLGQGITCNFGDNLNCDIVLTSDYSEIFGIPVALIGALSYLFIFIVAFSLRHAPLNILRIRQAALLAVSSFMILFDIYLFYISYFVIQSFCVFCIITYATTITIFLTLLLWRKSLDVGSLLLSLKAAMNDPFLVKTVGYLLLALLLFILGMMFT